MPKETTDSPQLTAAEIGALAHLYRGEMYRSKIWRTRLDMTTNWAVVTTGIALSVTFSNREASPLPIVLVSLLLGVFLVFEGRRYRFFDIWRTRVRVFENNFYGPILRGEGVNVDNGWSKVMAKDYESLHFHISLLEAMGRRLRRNYSWIFGIQAISYGGKLAIHPTPLATLDELWMRAAVGPIDGRIVLLAGGMWYMALIALALGTLRGQQAVGRAQAEHRNGDRMRELAR